MTPEKRARAWYQSPIRFIFASLFLSVQLFALSPAERAKSWYPNASAGGGNNTAVYDGVGHKFLWKPTSDSNGKAAVHTPHGLRIRSLTVAGKEYGVGSYGNGYRPLFRLDKPGSAYGSNVAAVMNLHDGRSVTVVVPSGGKRFEKNFAKPDDTASPGQGLPAPPPAAVQSIILPPEYSAKVGLVAVLSGRKMHQCARDPANSARWTHAGKKASHYGLRWNVRPGGSVATYNAGVLGLWSVTDGARFLSLAEILALLIAGPVEPPVVTPPPAPPNPTSLFSTTPDSLTLRSDFAAAVGQVKVLVRINDPHRPGSVGGAASTQVIPTRSGNTWTLPQPLASYPSGNVPNTWAYQVKGNLPAGATYHIDLGYGFIRSGDNPFGAGSKTYPPTTR